MSSDATPVPDTLPAPAPPSASPDVPRPLAPLDGAYVDASAVPFSWRGVPGATGYQLQVAASPDFSGDVLEVEAGETTALTLYGAFPVRETELVWRVRAEGIDRRGGMEWLRPVHRQQRRRRRGVPERAGPCAVRGGESGRPPSRGHRGRSRPHPTLRARRKCHDGRRGGDADLHDDHVRPHDLATVRADVSGPRHEER